MGIGIDLKRRENIIRCIKRDSPAWIPYRYDGSLTLLKPKVVVRPVAGGLDDWGVNWVATTDAEGSFPEGKPVLGIDEVESYQTPQTDWDAITEDLNQQIEDQGQADTLLAGCNELVLLERGQLLLGGEEFLAATGLQGEKLAALLDKITGYQQKLTEAIMKAGVAGVRFTDDWGIQRSLLMGPDRWRELIKPRLRRLYAIVKDYDGLVFQHSCGCIDEIVPDLIEIGLDVLDPCQPGANDIVGWKQRYGDELSFMGGLDTQGYLSFGGRDEVKEAVKAVVSVMGQGGGYVAAPSHTITIPSANEQAMLEAIAEVNDSGRDMDGGKV